MAYVIAVAGKGGVGKTTVSAFLIQYLIKKERPLLAIDADPNVNLNVLLGFEYKKTISDIREEARDLSSNSISRSEFFNMRLQEILAEGEGQDLLVMGRPEGPGCYCAVNNILREYLSKLSKNYKFVVIDNEAGMEHLSRRTAGNIDRLLLVSDNTMVGIRSIINSFQTAKNAGLKVRDVSVLINKATRPLEGEKLKLINEGGLRIDGYIPFQEEIQRDSESGKELRYVNSKDMDTVFENLIYRRHDG